MFGRNVVDDVFAKHYPEDVTNSYKKRQKTLLYSTYMVLGVFCLLFVWWLIQEVSNSLNPGKNNERVEQLDEDKAGQIQEQTRRERAMTLEEQYKEAGIPYEDPQGRFSIQFAGPYASSSVVVLIDENTNRQEAQEAAEDIISKAKAKGAIINTIKFYP